MSHSQSNSFAGIGGQPYAMRKISINLATGAIFFATGSQVRNPLFQLHRQPIARTGSLLARISVASVALWIGSALANLASAEVSLQDLQTIARAMAFLDPSPSGTADLGIVYPTGSAAGLAEAEQIAILFGDGIRAGSLLLRPRLLAVEEVGGRPVVALLLTSRALTQAGQVTATVAGKGIPTIVSEPAAVDAGQAVMAIRSEPRVEIRVSRTAARASGVAFVAAFRMMIQEH